MRAARPGCGDRGRATSELHEAPGPQLPSCPGVCTRTLERRHEPFRPSASAPGTRTQEGRGSRHGPHARCGGDEEEREGREKVGHEPQENACEVSSR